MFVAAASRFRVLEEGLALPDSSLLMSLLGGGPSALKAGFVSVLCGELWCRLLERKGNFVKFCRKIAFCLDRFW